MIFGEFWHNLDYFASPNLQKKYILSYIKKQQKEIML